MTPLNERQYCYTLTYEAQCALVAWMENDVLKVAGNPAPRVEPLPLYR